MLQGIRDSSKGIVAKVIVGFIVLTFAMFGVDSLVSLSQGSNAPATVNGEEITERDLYQAAQLQRRSILSSMGENADPSLLDDNLIQSLALNSLIQEKALLVEAADQEMRISDRMIDDLIVKTPNFFVDGKFNPAQFEATIRSAGYTPLTYREVLKKEQLIRQQRAGFALGSYVLPSAVKKVTQLDRQTRDIRYFSMPIAKVRELTVVTESEVKAQYDARKNILNTQEQVSIEYIELSLASLLKSVQITDEEIAEQYDQVLAAFESKEQRQAAHILIEVNDDVNDTQALKAIKDIKARLDAGEDFSALAKELSNDFGSAQNGGDLGVIAKGTFEAGFEDALYALEQNVVSEPVQSESGYHLIKVLKVNKTESPTLEESTVKIIAQLKTNKAEQLYLEQLEKLTDLAFISGDLTDPAAELGLEIKTLPAFSQRGGVDTLTQNTKLLRAAFSDDLVKEKLNSAPIELDRSNAVVFRVKEHLPVRAQTYDEVKKQLKESLLTDKALAALKARAKVAISEISRTGDATASAADFDLKSVLNASRIDTKAPVGVINKAFSLAHPESGKVSVGTATLADKSLAIVIVDKVIAADLTAISKDEMQRINEALAARLGNQAYGVFVQETEKAAEIERL